MTLYPFNRLPYKHQLAAVVRTSTFLATCWSSEREAVSLYELPGRFFAELTYDTGANQVTGLRSFRSPARLAAYAAGVRLPDWLPGTE